MLRVIAVLLVIPLMDAVLLAVIAANLLPVSLIVLLVVLTALIGMLLVRAEGRHTLAEIQRKAATGEIPTDELLDGAFLIAAGAFFLTPGLVTDFIALLLVLPPTRWPIRAAVKRWGVVPYIEAKTGGFASGQVYVGGFPNGAGGANGPGPAGSSSDGAGPTDGAGSAGGFDPADATDIDFDESDDE
jgi:UPF0716 protein FxsA